MIQSDRNFTLSKIVEELNISIGSANNIVHEQLGYRKTCAPWVPIQLTDEHKATQMGLSLEHVMHCHRESVTFLRRIVTGDEINIPHPPS